MKKLRPIFQICYCVIMITSGIMLVIGSGGGGSGSSRSGDQPLLLVAIWEENGFDRQMVLEDAGDFQYVSTAGGSPGVVEGSGTWHATDSDLTLNLTSGHFLWQESTNNAPISFTFQYEILNDTLELTFEILGQVSTTQYNRVG